MNSIKAIISGSLFIIVSILLLQLAYLMIAAGYTGFEKDYPFLKDISGIFKYLIALPVLLFITFLGGYISAAIANQKEMIHCLIVGLITFGGMIWLALENANLTAMGFILFFLMLVATVLGGVYNMRTYERN